MKFNQVLSEATLLKRHHRFLVEVALGNKKRRMLYCPNLGALPKCDVLGSRIWFAKANLISHGTLDVWELVEVDGGWLVNIDPKHARTLVREALQEEWIPQLKGYKFLQPPIVPSLESGIELLWREDGEQCFLHIESVLYGDEKGTGYFPETVNQGIAALRDLIAVREIGHRAILLYCVQHNGIQCISPNDQVDSNYSHLLREAINKGVEIIAYRANINLSEMILDTEVPVLLSAGIDLKSTF